MKERQTRLRRLRTLRSCNAPKWIVKSEQVALAMYRKGLKFRGIGKTSGKYQAELFARHVHPLMK